MEFTPREAPRDTNVHIMCVHEWVADQQRIWCRRPASDMPDPARQQMGSPVAHIDVFTCDNPHTTDSLIHQGAADRRVSWLDQQTCSSTSRLFEPPLPLHQQLSAD